jgi:hypothetical protein
VKETPTPHTTRAVELFRLNERRLAELAQRAVERGQTPREVMLVCILVDHWRELLDQLMPSHDWQPIRDRGEQPIARGTAFRVGLVEVLCALGVDLTGLCLELPPRRAR